MEQTSEPPPIPLRPRTLADLDADSLCHSAEFLSIRDISNLALTCKPLLRLAYSDAVWHRLFRDRWPYLSLPGTRAQYLSRHIALNQLKFSDPFRIWYSQSPEPYSHMLLNNNNLFLAQGSTITVLNPGPSFAGIPFRVTPSARTPSWEAEAPLCHGARITCMRLFSITDTMFFRPDMQTEDTALMSSSCDHIIRLWWKGRLQRSYKGHNGPVTTLADKFLGDCGRKLLASGGEDCTVRLWSLSSSGKRQPLLMTYHGHEKPISLLSTARHKASLLVSVARDSRIRVWDTAASRTSTSSPCVGMSSVVGPPVGMQCHGNICYIAAGSTVTAIDFRTMKRVSSIAIHPARIYSFAMLPAKWLISSGGHEKAMLWDIRKAGDSPEPVAELDGHTGSVGFLHMDAYKVVTGGASDCHVKVWETNTGSLANSLDCHPPGESESVHPLSAMVVDGCRIVTAGYFEEPGGVYYRDFSNCLIPNSQPDKFSGLKFWDTEAEAI